MASRSRETVPCGTCNARAMAALGPPPSGPHDGQIGHVAAACENPRDGPVVSSRRFASLSDRVFNPLFTLSCNLSSASCQKAKITSHAWKLFPRPPNLDGHFAWLGFNLSCFGCRLSVGMLGNV